MAIEQAMYFALGFLVAGLFMLMFLPAFWRRAMRLSMRRLQMLAPLTREQAVAERDLLRADFALREQKLAQRMEKVRAEKTQDLLDIGQKSARIADLDEKLGRAEANARDFERRLNETQTTLDQRGALLDSTEGALHEMTARVERLLGDLRAANANYQEFDRESKAERTRLASAHEAKIGAMHQDNTALRQGLEQLQTEHAKLLDEHRRLGDAHGELERLRPQFSTAVAAKNTLQQEFDALRVATREEIERKTNQIAHLENALRHARDEARDHADKLETARADNSMLQGAVDALRQEREKERERQRAEPGAESPLDAKAIAAIRQELVDLGARVLEDAGTDRAP